MITAHLRKTVDISAGILSKLFCFFKLWEQIKYIMARHCVHNTLSLNPAELSSKFFWIISFFGTKGVDNIWNQHKILGCQWEPWQVCWICSWKSRSYIAILWNCCFKLVANHPEWCICLRWRGQKCLNKYPYSTMDSFGSWTYSLFLTQPLPIW